jgi:hypothetical protein
MSNDTTLFSDSREKYSLGGLGEFIDNSDFENLLVDIQNNPEGQKILDREINLDNFLETDTEHLSNMCVEKILNILLVRNLSFKEVLEIINQNP